MSETFFFDFWADFPQNIKVCSKVLKKGIYLKSPSEKSVVHTICKGYQQSTYVERVYPLKRQSQQKSSAFLVCWKV